MAAELVPLENPAQQLQEQHLIQRVRDGKHELFYELVQPYEGRVYAAAFAILRNEADAEDAAQEAVLIVTPHGTFIRVMKPHVEGLLAQGYQGLDAGYKLRVKLTRTDVQHGYIDFVHA
jgi:hypothetical protein